MPLEQEGEFALLNWIKKRFKAVNHYIKLGIGDDAAFFKDILITTDSYVKDIHFSFDYLKENEVGQRVTCGAISDIIAMGGIPFALLLNLIAPKRMESKRIKNILNGIKRILDYYKVKLIGGDITEGKELVLSLTIIGKSKSPILRSGAKPGDYIYITGYPGISEAGRLLLFHKIRGFKDLKERHKTPYPRIEVMKKIKNYINAMIDTSDGLSTDAFHLAEESKLKMVIEKDKIPVHNDLLKACKILKKEPEEFILNGGEDYELLFTSKFQCEGYIKNVKVTKIGKVEEGRGVFLKVDGKETRLKPKGYQHFKLEG